MAFQNVKGTRDFYPSDMRKLNWICDAWRRVSLRNGFEEYDSPIFEYLDLFTAKSGPEIAEQLFSLTDRGGRQLAIRPEITPSLARMVNAKINALPRPIKWFSIPMLCRAERPQKGRLREFLQWNIDIIGEDSEIADAECVFVAIDALRELGLGADDVVVRYSSRALLSEVLKGLGLAEDVIPVVMAVLDKRSKLPAEVFDKMLADVVVDQTCREKLMQFLNCRFTADGAQAQLAGLGLPMSDAISGALAKLQDFERYLKFFGVDQYCQYDTGIVRGLAYYTGIVYEIFSNDKSQSLRAVAGGGRYDNLLQVLGGPRVGAVGLGMGDPVLGILLDEKGKTPASLENSQLDYFVIDDNKDQAASLEQVMQLVSVLRGRGKAADFSYKRQNLAKQLQQANRRLAATAVIIISADGKLAVKNLATGQQQEQTLQEFLAGL
jgi:histidyl-tRNA synthetase